MSLASDLLSSLLGPTADPDRILLVLLVGFVVAAIVGELLRRSGQWISRRLRRLLDPYDIDHMSGVEFEDFLAELFRKKGFTVEKTAVTGDYGVDLILTNPVTKQRIAVQAKRYAHPVGIEAVQQVYFGAAYYRCHRAIVVTNADFTPNARNGAAKVGVWLVDGTALKAEIRRIFGHPANQVA